MKARIYTRVSTDDQVEGYSLEIQLERCKSYVLSQGWKIEAHTSDDGFSGYFTDRPGLKGLLDDAVKKKFDVVVFYKLDRFCRKLKDLLVINDLLEGYGIAIKSVTEPFDTLTSHGKLLFQVLGSFAEFERNRIKERVFPGMIKGVQNGHWQGARYAPFGYRYDKNEKRLIVVPGESEVVKLIFNRASEDIPIDRITKDLYNTGILNTRTGKPLANSLIKSILKNPIYTGKVVWNRHGYDKNIKVGKTYRYVRKPKTEWIAGKGSHEPLIGERDFDYIQGLLEVRANKLRESGFISQGRRNLDSEHILSGILFCSCGETAHGDYVISNRRLGVYKRRYRCISYVKYGKSCGEKTVYADKIEGEILNILKEVVSLPEFSTRLAESLTESLLEDNPVIKSQIRHYRSRLERCDRKIEILLHEFLEGEVDPSKKLDRSFFGRVCEEINEEKAYLKRKIKDLKERVAPEMYKETIDKFLTLLSNFDKIWERFKNEEKKGFLRAVFSKVIISEKAIKEVIFKEGIGNLLKEKEKVDAKGKRKSRVDQDLRMSDEFP